MQKQQIDFQSCFITVAHRMLGTVQNFLYEEVFANVFLKFKNGLVPPKKYVKILRPRK